MLKRLEEVRCIIIIRS